MQEANKYKWANRQELRIWTNKFEVNLTIVGVKIRHDHKWGYRSPVQTCIRWWYVAPYKLFFFLQQTTKWDLRSKNHKTGIDTDIDTNTLTRAQLHSDMKIYWRQKWNTYSDITPLTKSQHVTNTTRTIQSQELRPELDPLMPVQGATPQNVIHRLIITPATTQRNASATIFILLKWALTRVWLEIKREITVITGRFTSTSKNQGESRIRGNIEKAYLPISPPYHLLYHSINRQDFIWGHKSHSSAPPRYRFPLAADSFAMRSTLLLPSLPTWAGTHISRTTN
jgi:hypothetical protein